MGTQKPGEWASLVLTRFEDQVRELRRSACRVGLLFSLVSWPSSSPSSSLLVRLTPRYPLPVWLPPPPNVTSTMYSVSLRSLVRLLRVFVLKHGSRSRLRFRRRTPRAPLPFSLIRLFLLFPIIEFPRYPVRVG